MFKQKRGQETIGMSFGFIFSIILIIVLIGVAIYAIVYFVGLGKCANVGVSYGKLQDEINKAWNADQYEDKFEIELPTDIESVCFGNISLTVRAGDTVSGDLQRELKRQNAGSDKSNVFLYPPKKACDGKLESNVLKNVKIDKFFCVRRDSAGKFEVSLGKSSTDALVRVS